MKKSSRSKQSWNKVFQNPVVLVALITGIVGIVTTYLSILPNLSRPENKPEPPAQSVGTLPSGQPTLTPITVLASSEITLTPTINAALPSDTAVPTAKPVSLTCLEDWEVVHPPEISYETVSRERCSLTGIPDFGFSTNANDLLLTLNKFRKIGIFGFSTSLPDNAIVRLKVKADVLFNAEFWVALAGSASPESRSVILAVDPRLEGQPKQPGSIRVYQDGMDSRKLIYERSRLFDAGSTSSINTYDILFKVTGGKVAIWVNNRNLELQILNVPKYHLFIGYRNKSSVGSVSMDVTVSDLEITAGK